MSKFQILVAQKYRIGELIHSGNGRDIFEGENIFSGEKVAIKLEGKNKGKSKIFQEAKILNILQGALGVPLIYWNGEDGEYNVIATELLGKDLETLKDLYCKASLSLKTGLMIADQAISIIEYCHSKNIVHRDICPSNFCMGLDNNFFNVHLVNFERAKVIQEFFGDPMFTSLAHHEGRELSPKDDLESLMYSVLYMMTGCLPWASLLVQNELSESLALKEIYFLKKEFTGSEYWQEAIVSLTGSELGNLVAIPGELRDLYEEIRKLKIDDLIDYDVYRNVIREIMASRYLEYDYIYDWVLIPASEKISLNLKRVDDSYDESSRFSVKEEQLIQELVREYERDPTLIDSKMEEIKRKVQKYEFIEVQKKYSTANKTQKSKILDKKGKTGEKDKCKLI